MGSLEEIDHFFRDSARRATSGLSVSDYLAQKQPEAHCAMQQVLAGGHLPSVIEAVGHGVIVQPFEESGRADYLAALSPRIDAELRLRALVRAFSHFGEPYDYNFDFATDQTVVCSELVAKALLPNSGAGGIVFPLTRQNGRFLLPPNETPASLTNAVARLRGSNSGWRP